MGNNVFDDLSRRYTDNVESVYLRHSLNIAKGKELARSLALNSNTYVSASLFDEETIRQYNPKTTYASNLNSPQILLNFGLASSELIAKSNANVGYIDAICTLMDGTGVVNLEELRNVILTLVSSDSFSDLDLSLFMMKEAEAIIKWGGLGANYSKYSIGHISEILDAIGSLSNNGKRVYKSCFPLDSEFYEVIGGTTRLIYFSEKLRDKSIDGVTEVISESIQNPGNISEVKEVITKEPIIFVKAVKLFDAAFTKEHKKEMK